MSQASLPREPAAGRWLLALLALGLLAFAVRLAGVVIGAGLGGERGFDDTVYFTGAVALLDGRLPYRDFNTLHPPGIFYLLSPFALVARATDEMTGFMLARVAVMVLGAVNTVLVGFVGRRVGWGTGLAAAALYAVWLVSMVAERTTYLVAPQTALLLVALLQLTGRGPGELTTRRVAIAGVALGIAGSIQIWMAIPALVILGWLVWTCRADTRRALRTAATFVLTGAATAALLLAPMLIATGQRMLQLILFAQASRVGSRGPGLVARLRALEGVSAEQVGFHVPAVVVLAALLVVAAAVAVAAWRRPPVRLWVAIVVAQTAFVMVTPVFFRHYAAWPAPLAALCIGAAVATFVEPLAAAWRRLAVVAYAAGLVVLLVLAVRPDGRSVPVDASRPDLSAARCVVADKPILLLATRTLHRSLEHGCKLLPNPWSLLHYYRSRPELGAGAFQAMIGDYFTSADSALFGRLHKDVITDATMARIRAALPHEQQIRDVLVRSRTGP